MIEKLSILRNVLFLVVQMLFSFVVIVVFIYALMGEGSGGFVVSVINNITDITSSFGSETIVSLAILFASLCFLKKYQDKL
jgi:hypothetical protein